MNNSKVTAKKRKEEALKNEDKRIGIALHSGDSLVYIFGDFSVKLETNYTFSDESVSILNLQVDKMDFVIKKNYSSEINMKQNTSSHLQNERSDAGQIRMKVFGYVNFTVKSITLSLY